MEETTPFIGRYAPDFELPGTDGRVYHLATTLEQFPVVVVVFMCNHCPYVRMYLDRLKQIQTEFQDKGVLLVGINANDDRTYPEDSFEKMKTFAQEQHLNFPYLRDMTQEVARTFGAERTPEIFLLDQSGVIRYHGAIDDNAQDASAVKKAYLREAIAQLLKGESPVANSTHAIGCSVKWRS